MAQKRVNIQLEFSPDSTFFKGFENENEAIEMSISEFFSRWTYRHKETAEGDKPHLGIVYFNIKTEEYPYSKP